jgi:hypothetical protein
MSSRRRRPQHGTMRAIDHRRKIKKVIAGKRIIVGIKSASTAAQDIRCNSSGFANYCRINANDFYAARFAITIL